MAKQDKGKNFGIILYPDNPDLMNVLKHVKQYACVYEWTWFAILHDKDKAETEANEEEKKPHYHLVLIQDGTKTVGYMANRLKLPDGYPFIEPVNANPRGMLRYLVHMDNQEKYQYSPNEVVGSEDYTTYLNGLSRTRNADDSRRAFITLADSYDYAPTYLQLMKDCQELGLGRWFDRNQALVKSVHVELQRQFPKDVYDTVQERAEKQADKVIAEKLKKAQAELEAMKRKYAFFEADQQGFMMLPDGVQAPFEEERK